MTEITEVELEPEAEPKSKSHTRVALAVALLASFVALSNIKSANVNEAMLQAQAERNNSWAWYQAVRVREDMASYQLADLKREARAADVSAPEAALLAAEIAAQDGELARVRARLKETSERAQQAEKDYAFLNAVGDQYDFTDAMIAIAITVLAVSTLANVGWLFWFALAPGVIGLAVGVAAMMRIVLPLQQVFALLG
jgi:hypothetical protein